ncbi:MAG TPA: hypothetical protein VK809_02100 [Bacteroidia bacterium]|jgi:hypothetical protein|nr:hypothetical protein [Bacteroidia bacterium]
MIKTASWNTYFGIIKRFLTLFGMTRDILGLKGKEGAGKARTLLSSNS